MAISCEDARLRCAYRTGCGNALQSYAFVCSSILHENLSDQCPEACQNALIGLTSTDEGKDLMTCECTDSFCNETKQKFEVCRPQVMKAVKSDTIVTCEVAQWICAADATCLKALEYYRAYCHSMFAGKRCSFRCKNSITILRKQEKATKLDSCVCNGKEEYDCPRIRTNMAKLCFNKTIEVPQIVDVENNDVKPSFSDKGNEIEKDVPNDIDNASSRFKLPSTFWIIAFLLTSRYFTC